MPSPDERLAPSGRLQKEQPLPSALPFVVCLWIPTLAASFGFGGVKCWVWYWPDAFAALSVGRLSGFGKAPVHTASQKADGKSGISKTLFEDLHVC